jgi:two-component sensor histidine kinase/PAS domain-containing protein
MQSWSPSGLQSIPQLEWGSHLAHFFGSGDELREVMVPYFKAGLENNERCLWVLREPADVERARSALREVVPDLAERENSGQIEIANAGEWYSSDSEIDPEQLVAGLVAKERDALVQGFVGLRTNGNCSWVSAGQWPDFLEYEQRVQEASRGRRMILICSYCEDELHDGAHLDLMDRHDMAIRPRLAKRGALGRDPARKPDRHFEQQKRTFDLAMAASQMGTWRYTISDNICVYDENAQRLYGLTESRFLHDAEGVKEKFHAEDMDVMWTRVAAALDPLGDGRYDVEYRVKQLDGSWRWLSAWGLVEFEGEGEDRKPVAIAGASMDLTQRKQAEDHQRLLLNELNHRVKNTLATIQAITTKTLASASDLPSARDAVDRRIVSMAKAHDILTSRAWSGANLAEVVARALDAFSPAQVTISGPAIDITARQTLALSMALHELATNATKYGALSCTNGRVRVEWDAEDGQLQLRWQESGGRAVSTPERKGFGSQLLERLLVRDLGAEIHLNYDPAGLRFSLSAAL